MQTLNALPEPQFNELIFALQPPNGNVPGPSAPQGTRSSALLTWVESPIGPGLPDLEKVLAHSMKARSTPMQQDTDTQALYIQALQDMIQTLQANQAPKYDFRGATFAGGFAETVYGDQIGTPQRNSET